MVYQETLNSQTLLWLVPYQTTCTSSQVCFDCSLLMIEILILYIHVHAYLLVRTPRQLLFSTPQRYGIEGLRCGIESGYYSRVASIMHAYCLVYAPSGCRQEQEECHLGCRSIATLSITFSLNSPPNVYMFSMKQSCISMDPL